VAHEGLFKTNAREPPPLERETHRLPKALTGRAG